MAGFSGSSWGGSTGVAETLIDEVSMTTNITGDPLSVLGGTIVGLQFVWTGTPTGTFAVDFSNDYVPGGIENGTWEDVTSSLGLVNPTGAASHHFENIDAVGAAYIRVRYVFTSGTGTLTVTGVAK